jgi:2-methylcitrate dehydratase PrpD
MTILEKLGQFVATHEGASSKSTREHLALHLLDAVGAWIAGSATEEGKSLARLKSDSQKSLSAFGEGPLDRIAIGAGTTRLTEIDDIHMPSCTTPSAVVVPTALILAAYSEQIDENLFAQALSAGYEVMTRWGAAISGPTIVYRGLWPTYLAAPLGSAAVAARLLNLDALRTANALAIALATLSGAPGGHTESTSRWLLLGLGARAGCVAALSASEGFASDRSLLDDDWLVRTHGVHLDAAPLEASAIEEGAVGSLTFKPYCSAKQAIAAIDGFRDLLSQGISPDEIQSLRIGVPSAYAAMIGHHRAAAGHIERITSAAYHMALVAHRPDALDDIARPNLTLDSKISGFMDRVEVAADESLNQFYPQRWPARVEVLLKSGERKAILVLDARGDPSRTLDCTALQRKFHRIADPVLGKHAADTLAERTLNSLENRDALAALLSAASGSFSEFRNSSRGGA